ncbi:MAG: 30S ribosomal protein S12 methylthiotransferase RimO [Verrucomicrobiales bacterium]|nr:30S ribosomal protein S12 methylthiotransferase RimO [Verrucomicrobiales bacterium]
MKSKNQAPVRVGLISLGCAKNLVDAEIMLGALLKSGVEITNDPGKADALIVNTCSFIDSAQEESVDAILESAAERDRDRPQQGLIVSGCMPQRFREELPKLLPEVDAFMGIDQVENVSELVRQAVEQRREKLDNQAAGAKSRAGSRKKQISARLEELDRKAGPDHHHGHTEDHAPPGSAGRTRTVLEPAPAAAPGAAIMDVHVRPTYIPDYATPRFRLTPKHFAYVKIAEGCNHPCSFCIIPRMRGSHRSRVQSDIVKEAKQLLAEGVKELNLISQDSTYYGLDLRPGHSRAISSPEKFTAATRSLRTDSTTLGSLLRELNALPGDFWIRLLYTHPAHWTDELIQTIAECAKVARYIDMPLQHIHDVMLERMRRETSRAYIEELITRIRAGIPGVTLRTTFIVGFPGETDAYFKSLLGFIRDTRFERLGVFTYSKEEGTRAGKMEQQVTERVKAKRREAAMAEQHLVARSVSESFVGRTLKVLIEGQASARDLKKANVSSWEHGLIREQDADLKQLKGDYWIGRGEADAPDIDGRIYIRGNVNPGRFAQIKIIGHTDYDLIGQAVQRGNGS